MGHTLMRHGTPQGEKMADDLGATSPDSRLALELLKDLTIKLRTAVDYGILDLDDMSLNLDAAKWAPSQVKQNSAWQRRRLSGFSGEYSLVDLADDVQFYQSRTCAKLFGILGGGELSMEKRVMLLRRMKRKKVKNQFIDP